MPDFHEYEQDLTEEIKQEKRLTTEKKTGYFFLGMLAGIILSMGISAFILWRITGSSASDSARSARVLTSSATSAKLSTVKQLLETYYLFDIDEKRLESSMFMGVAAGLGDRYAAYYSPEELEEVERENEGAYFGIGVVISEDEKGPFIYQIYEGSSAWQAGLQAGDRILAVEGQDVSGSSLEEAVSLISARREKGSVQIRVLRGDEKVEAEVSFGRVETIDVSSEMIGDDVGYIRVSEFAAAAVEEFREQVEEMKQSGMKTLIVDVRDNPGGLLDSVCSMLSMIVPGGVIVSTRTREGAAQDIYAEGERIFDGVVAVLVNENSASASELFAGAVQDFALGPVVGSRTFGKGVVQSTFYLNDGSAFKMTTEKYLTAAGRDIDGVGIIPDAEIEDREETKIGETGLPEQNTYMEESDSALEIAIQEAFAWNRK